MVSEEGYTTYADTFTHLARVVRLAGSALDGRLGLVSLSDCDDRESVLPDSFVAWFDHSAAPVPPEAALYLVRRLAGASPVLGLESPAPTQPLSFQKNTHTHTHTHTHTQIGRASCRERVS